MAIVNVDHTGINALDKEGYTIDIDNNKAKYNQFFKFDATNDKSIRIVDNKKLNSLIAYDGGTEKSTWSFWIKRVGNANDSNERIWMFENGLPYMQFVPPSGAPTDPTRIWFITKARVDESHTANLIWKSVDDVIITGKKQNVSLTIDMSGDLPNIKIYVDGVSAKLLEPTILSTVSSMKIAPFGIDSSRNVIDTTMYICNNGLAGASNRNFNGEFDEMTIWNRILDESEIRQIIDVGRKGIRNYQFDLPRTEDIIFRMDGTTHGNRIIDVTNNFDYGCIFDPSDNIVPLTRTGSSIQLVKEDADLASLSNRLDPFQYPAWKQIRTGEHSVSRAQRKNNIISVENKPKDKTSIINGQILRRKSKRGEGSTNFTEPPITSKYKPMRHTFLFKGNVNPLLGHRITHTYANNLVYFANKELNSRLSLEKTDEQMYDRLFEMYGDPDYPEDENPVNKFLKFTYSEVVWPKEQNTYLARTRGRTRYILDEPGYGEDGYDRQFGTQRAFWRDDVEDRKRTEGRAINSQGYTSSLTTGSGAGQDIFTKVSGTYLGIVGFQYTGSTTSSYSLANSFGVDSIFPMEELSAGVVIYYTGTVKHNITSSLSTGPGSEIANSSSFLAYYHNDYGEINRRINVDIFSKHSQETTTGNPLILTQVAPPLYRAREYIFFTQIDFEDEVGYNVGNLHSSLELLPEPRLKYIFDFVAWESGSRTPSYNTEDFFNEQASGRILSTLDEGLKRKTNLYAGKNPWYDSYEEYSEDIKLLGKDCSLFPEFRISEHMNYFVNDAGGNFRKSNTKFLSIDGSGVRNSSHGETERYDDNFYSHYSHADLLKEKNKVSEDNKNIIKNSNISFKVSGIKKLLPYNGFYPINHIVQIANVFRDSSRVGFSGGFASLQTSGSVILTNNEETRFILRYHESGAIADRCKDYASLEPFFAPGIAMNTIKSGIAVDWPIYTSSFDQNLLVYTLNPQRTTSFVVVGENVGGPQASTDDGSPYESGFSAEMISNVPSSRLPFETLLEPETVPLLRESINTESFLTASLIKEGVIHPISVSYRQGEGSVSTFYNRDWMFGASGPDNLMVRETSPYFYNNGNSNYFVEYKMSMNNFLAEVVKFFLKDRKLVSFSSKSQKEWKEFESNKSYYMDILLKKNEDLTMIKSYFGDYHMTSSTGRVEDNDQSGKYFGPPIRAHFGSNPDTINSVYNNPSYSAYTPPYFEGESIARIKFTPNSPGKKTLEEIFSGSEIENIFSSFDYEGSTVSGSIAHSSSMPVESSLNIFGKTYDKKVVFDLVAGGLEKSRASSIEDLNESGNEKWIISSKFETPVLDFSEQPMEGYSSSYILSGSSGFGIGMWSGYGNIPTGSQGIYAEIRDSFPILTRAATSSTGSLLDQVGFQKSSEKVGQLASSKEISEAIVAIPFLDNQESFTTNIDCHNFIKIDRENFNKQRENVANGQAAISQGDLNSKKTVQSTSISRMIETMENYVIPPQYNFLEYDDIEPFVMYMFEFKHVLDQQDLADIWQGVMPKIAMAAEKDEVEFSHPSGQFEFFHGEDLPQNLRWLVFKVKKKAEWSYFNVTADSTDDDRFQFDFEVGRKAPEYSYNWPYDYFSLVELGKLEIDLEYTNSEDVEKAIQKGSTQTLLNQGGPSAGSLRKRKKLKG